MPLVLNSFPGLINLSLWLIMVHVVNIIMKLLSIRTTFAAFPYVQHLMPSSCDLDGQYIS